MRIREKVLCIGAYYHVVAGHGTATFSLLRKILIVRSGSLTTMVVKNWKQKVVFKSTIQIFRFGEMTVSHQPLFHFSGCQMYQKKIVQSTSAWDNLNIFCPYQQRVLFLSCLQSFYGLCSFSDNQWDMLGYIPWKCEKINKFACSMGKLWGQAFYTYITYTPSPNAVLPSEFFTKRTWK
jgi:hypothetical protein